MYKIILIVVLVIVESYAGKYYGSIKAGYSSIGNSKIVVNSDKQEIESSFEPQFDIQSIAVGMFHGRYTFEAEYSTDKFTQKEQMWSKDGDKFTANDIGTQNSLDIQALYANAYYYPRYKLYGALPYIGGGMGLANIKVVAIYDYGAYSENAEETTMAGHITGGFIKKFDRDIYVGVSTRLAKYMPIKYKNSRGEDMTYEPGLSGGLSVGVRVLF